MISKTLPLSSFEEAEILALLQAMELDVKYHTPERYSSDTKKYPDNTVSYALAQLAYIKKYPNIDPYQYIKNLKLTSRA